MTRLKKTIPRLAALTLISVLTAAPAFAQKDEAKQAEAAKEQAKPAPDLLAGKLTAPLPANTFVELAKLVNPSVVNIWTQRTPGKRQQNRQNRGRDPLYDLFEQFMGPNAMPPQEATGTGFIIREDGLIITNAHVVEGAEKIKVQFNEKGKIAFDAKIIGSDDRTDIALLKIEPGEKQQKKFQPLKLGESKNVAVGEWVAAFGNPLGLGHTMTKGIISAKGRDISELNRFPFLQTDASINPGNSGGPLVNVKGYVVGVNTAIARGNGIGFAIPIDDVKFIIEKLEKEGRIIRGFIGVSFNELTDQAVSYFKLKTRQGIIVQAVMDDGPAKTAGLKPGDIITVFAGRKIFATSDLVNAVANSDIGSKQRATVIREGEEIEKEIEIGIHPADRDGAKVAKVAEKEITYDGQKAPFDLGFFFKQSNRELREIYKLDNDPRRPVVIKVEPGSPASLGGLQVGDVIVAVNQKKISTTKSILRHLTEGPNALTISRQGSERFVFIEP